MKAMQEKVKITLIRQSQTYLETGTYTVDYPKSSRPNADIHFINEENGAGCYEKRWVVEREVRLGILRMYNDERVLNRVATNASPRLRQTASSGKGE